MTTITISDDKLLIQVQGWDKLWAMKSHLEVPLQHVKRVRSAAEEHAQGIHVPGTYLPGIVVAGTFYQIGKKVFWDVHNPERAIAIDLHDERYTTLVLEVEHPEATVSEIEKSIAAIKA
jgi:hypothetical protein